MELMYSIWFLFMAYILYSDESLDSSIKRVIDTFDFHGESGLIQFWRCSPLGDPNDIGCSLRLADQFCLSTLQDNRLMGYRMTCFLRNPFIGLETNVGNWFAGRAAQTGVGDHRTRHAVLNHDHQYVDESSGMGQLVVPVYSNNLGDGLKFAGIIELVTTQPKESYVADFNRIHDLLMMVNLTSTYMGKTIKVKYNANTVKFTLPFLAKLTNLQEQVTMRFQELKNKTFCIKYEDTDQNCHSILSDQDLEFCIGESISNRTTVIRMFVDHVMVNLTSTYMGKTIKVKYNANTVKFTLPFLAKLTNLQEQVTMRFKELKNKTFCIKYEDTDQNYHSILSDQDARP